MQLGSLPVPVAAVYALQNILESACSSHVKMQMGIQAISQLKTQIQTKTFVQQMSPEPGSTAQLLWSHPVLTSIQQQAADTAQLSLCSLSAVNMSSNRQNIAVLANAADGTLALQLLSVSPDSKPEELSTHVIDLGHEARAEGSKKGSKWCCCLSRHGEVMLWRQGGTAHRWTLQKGQVAWK